MARRYYYEDGREPWRPDDFLQRFVKKVSPERPASAKATAGRREGHRETQRRALDLGMGYGRNALWLAEQGYEVEGWEMDRRYVREARRESRLRQGLPAMPAAGGRQAGCGGQVRRRQQEMRSHPRPGRAPTPENLAGANGPSGGATHKAEGRQAATPDEPTHGEGRTRRARLRVKFRAGDFTRARLRGPYDVIVISLALHQVKRSAGLRVLRAARRALGEGGRLFLLVKLTRDRYFQRWKRSPDWEAVAGERNTLRRLASHPQPWLLPALKRKHSDDVAPEGAPRQWRIERVRRRGQIQSALTPSELKAALRGLKVRHYREVVLRSDWDESERVTHHVAEVVAEK